MNIYEITKFISLGALLLAGFVVASFFIPLQWKQAGVKNGLKKLRQLLLLKGVLSLGVIVTAILVLSLRFFTTDFEVIALAASFLILLFSLGILGKAIIDYNVYHQQYSQESKDMHTRIDKLEQGDKSRAKKARLDKSQKKV